MYYIHTYTYMQIMWLLGTTIEIYAASFVHLIVLMLLTVFVLFETMFVWVLMNFLFIIIHIINAT